MPYVLHSPFWLLALLLLPFVFWARGRRRLIAWVVPFAAAWHSPATASPSRIPIWLATGAAALFIAALARPQRIEDRRIVNSQGYDLMLAIDLSTSMLAEDYERNGERINRLQTIAPIIKAFINERAGDRIGITVFAGRAYTLAPLTLDHDWLGKQVERLRTGLVEDGTAIGDGLGVALSRLEQKARYSQNAADGADNQEQQNRRLGAFIVLLTDGANNRGTLTPAQAAAIAKARGIPVYTVGVGRGGVVRMPRLDRDGKKTGGYIPVQSDLDENSLRYIAAETGGRYFRADATDTVQSAFKAIDEARKIEFQVKSQLLTTELFLWFAGPGAALALLACLLRRSFRSGEIG